MDVDALLWGKGVSFMPLLGLYSEDIEDITLTDLRTNILKLFTLINFTYKRVLHFLLLSTLIPALSYYLIFPL